MARLPGPAARRTDQDLTTGRTATVLLKNEIPENGIPRAWNFWTMEFLDNGVPRQWSSETVEFLDNGVPRQPIC